MNLTLAQIRRTNAYLAVEIRRIFLRPFSIALYLVVLAPLMTRELWIHNPRPINIAIGLIAGWLWVLSRLAADKQDEPNDPGDATIASELSYHMVQHLSAKTEITPTTILDAATESERGLFVLHQLDMDRSTILHTIKKQPLTCTLEECLEWMKQAMEELSTKKLDSTATIYAFLTHVPALTTLLNTADLSTEDLAHVLRAEAFHFYLEKHRRHRLSPNALVRTIGSIGRTWVIGYNSALERLTTNISENVLSHERSVVIHRDSILSMEKALAGGSGSNLLILGNTGTGKRTLLQNLAYAIRKREMVEGKAFTDVLILKTAVLLSGTAQGDKELFKALDDASLGGRFILVVEDIGLLLKAADPRLKEILFKILQSKNVRVACIAVTSDYHTLIKSDALLDSLFQKIYLEDTNDIETMAVLLEEYFSMEYQRKVRMTYRVLKVLMDLSKQYIGRGGLPGKAVEILQESVATTRGNRTSVVTEEVVRETISQRTRIDVRALNTDVRDALRELEQRLKNHIIGQERAVTSLVNALKRGKVNLQTRKRPIGTFLFLGSTGVGKTETAKALAEEYFGNAESFIRVDMNELSDERGIRTLIGGQTETGFIEGFLTKRVLDRPFSLILLDEIEKAHPKVLHLLLQMLDEGTLIDGQGLKTDFRNTIIIATSNAGSKWISEHTMPFQEQERDAYRGQLVDAIVAEHVFSPEFVNRFDEVIVFSVPTKAEVQQLAILMLGGIINDIQTQRGIRITVDPAVIDTLVSRGYNPEFGAREMRRTITQTIENYLADYLLSHNVKRGDEITISEKDVERKA